MTIPGFVFSICLAGVSAQPLPDLTNFPGYAATPAQPKRMANWPMVKDSNNNTVPANCWKTAVVKDKANGWPGQCLGLEQVVTNQTVTAEMCREMCIADPTCSVWQLSEDGCWTGQGVNCYARDGGTPKNVTGAQRIVRGDVTVLKNMNTTWVFGLEKVGSYSEGSAAEDIERCRQMCYSDINCEFWQFGNGGCFAENKNKKATNPLVLVNDSSSSTGAESYIVKGPTNPARSIMAAEYIRHTCPPPPPAPTAAPKEAGSSSMTLLIGLGVVGLIGLAIAAFACMGGKGSAKTRAVKKTRAIKTVQRADPPAVEPEAVPLVPLMQPATAPMMQFAPAPVMQYAPQMVAPAPQAYQQVQQFQTYIQ